MKLSNKKKKKYFLVILVITGILLMAEIFSGNIGTSLFFIVLFGGMSVAYIHYEKFADTMNKYF